LLFPGRDEAAVFFLGIADRLALAVAHRLIAVGGGRALLLAAAARRMTGFELEFSDRHGPRGVILIAAVCLLD
jgi:hypothetical protein